VHGRKDPKTTLSFRLSLFQKPELLGRDIHLSDLDDEDDKTALRLGLFQLLKRYEGRNELSIHQD
jgi:hypothetical protein